MEIIALRFTSITDKSILEIVTSMPILNLIILFRVLGFSIKILAQDFIFLFNTHLHQSAILQCYINSETTERQ